jgi:hypothetical protein
LGYALHDYTYILSPQVAELQHHTSNYKYVLCECICVIHWVYLAAVHSMLIEERRRPLDECRNFQCTGVCVCEDEFRLLRNLWVIASIKLHKDN